MKINWLWDSRLKEEQVRIILQDGKNPRFYIYAEKLFVRLNDPKTVFEYISKEVFCQRWPQIKKRIKKDVWAIDRVNFWQTIYERIHERFKEQGILIRQVSDENIPPERKVIAQQIKNTRIKIGYTQKEMARRLGVIQQHISRMESGRENMTVETLCKFAKALDKNLVIRFI